MKKNYRELFTCIKLGMCFALLLLLGSNTYAQTWNGSVSSEWDNPANWNSGNVPGNQANVTIPGNQPNNPVITSEITIQQITIGNYSRTALLTVENSGNITITNSMSLGGGGQLHIDGGAVNITGGNFTQVYNANTFFEMTNGSFSINGNVDLQGGNNTSNPAFSAGSGTVDIGGNLTVFNNKIFNAGTGSISVQGTIQVNGTYNGEDGITDFYRASTIGSGGVVSLDTGLITFHDTSTISGNGTINMGSGEVIFNSDINVASSGFVNVDDGTMTVTGDAVFRGNGNLSTNTGSINIIGNANLQNGGEINLNSGSLNVGGSATIKQGGIMNAGSAHINLKGDFSVQEGRNFNPGTSTFTFSGDEIQTISVDNGDNITFYNVVVENGTSLQTDGSNPNTVIIENNLTVKSGGSVNIKDNDQIDIQGRLDDEDENIVIKKPYVRHVTTPSLTEVVLEFDKDMVGSTLENISNYFIDNGIRISNAEQNPSNPRFVTLTVSTLTEDVEYEIIINNVEATNGELITPNHIKRFNVDVIDPCEYENIWTGTENTNWNNTANWSCNTLPSLETDVLIPQDLASNNYPEINAGANAYTRNLTIENNASIEVNENWLRIAGELKNNGVLNTETGSVSFQGTDLQNIPIDAFENNRIRNIRIDNTSGVTSEALIEVTGILNVENGNFDTGDDLILISDENQTALIDGSGNGEVTGLVSMQRYLDNAFGYKYFSSPFQNSKVGDFAPYMDFQDPETEFPNFYRYNENRNVDINDTVRDATGWTVYTNPVNNLNIAEGYALNFGTSTDAQTIDLIGEVNNGPITARQLENNHREYTKGFHLVGNPYPSPIDWNASKGWTRNNIEDGIYFFTAGDDSQYSGTYTAYVNNISTEAFVDGRSSNIIPSMQGFFIKVSDSDSQDLVTGSFGMDNRVRVTNFDQKFLKTQEDLKPLIRLEAGFQNISRKDPMVIYFSSYATPNFEQKMDAHKLMNTDPNVPSLYNITQDKKELSINAIPFPENKSYNKIPLGIKADQSGEMKINLASMENLSANFNIYLIDHEKSIGQNLSRKPEYSFRIKAGIHNSRFELMFSEQEVTSPAIAFNEPFDVEVQDGDVIVNLNLEENQQGILRASTMTGQILQVKPVGGKDKVIFEGITSDGVYIINLQLGKAQYAKKVVIKK